MENPPEKGLLIRVTVIFHETPAYTQTVSATSAAWGLVLCCDDEVCPAPTLQLFTHPLLRAAQYVTVFVHVGEKRGG